MEFKTLGYETFLISINEPTEKIKYIKTHGIQPRWFQGLRGNTIETMDRLDYLSPFFSPIAPYSAIGCAISHMKAWETFLEESKDHFALILEDDVILIEGFKKTFEDCLTSFEYSQWDLMHLGCFGCDPSAVKVNVLEISLWALGLVSSKPQQAPLVALGLHAYVISRKGAQKLLEGLKGKLWCPIDFGIQWLVSRGDLIRSAYLPRIAFQTSTDEIGNSSNINSQHPQWLLRWLSCFYIDEYLRASYLFGGSLLRIGNFHFNLLSLVFVIVGYIGAWIGLSILGLVLLFLFVSLYDLWKGDYWGTITHFILYIAIKLVSI